MTDFVHFSQISTFLKCRHRHDLSYIERLEPLQQRKEMLFGTLGHAVLADAWLGTTTHLSSALDRVLEEFDDDPQGVMATAEAAKQVAMRAFPRLTERFQIAHRGGERLAEVSLTTDIDGITVGGTPDAVVVDREDGCLWVLDYKFRNAFMPPESELLNLQMIFYQGLLARNDVNTAGTRQIQIRPFLPKEPKLKTDGQVSKAACATDWPTYAAAVLRVGGNLEDYADMKQKLDSVSFMDIDSCKTLRSEEEVEWFWHNEIVPAVLEIRDRKVPGPGRCFDPMQCRGCSFREICVEEAKGGDIDYLKRTLFRIKGEPKGLQIIIEDE